MNIILNKFGGEKKCISLMIFNNRSLSDKNDGIELDSSTHICKRDGLG